MDERTTDPPAGDAAPPQPPVPRIGADGEPIYDQEFFLALARCGKKVWNRWRDANPQIPVTFRGVDFRVPENSQIDFSGYKFGSNSNFVRCKFGDGPNLLGPTAGAFKSGMAKFTFATFDDFTNFSNSSFGSNSNFISARFGKFAVFQDTNFGVWTRFENTAFGSWVNFSNARFASGTNFTGSVFEFHPEFAGARFDGRTSFDGASEQEWSQNAEKKYRTYISDEEWVKLRDDHSKYARDVDGRQVFPIVSFSGTNFMELLPFQIGHLGEDQTLPVRVLINRQFLIIARA